MCLYNLALCIIRMPLIVISDDMKTVEEKGLFALIMIEISMKLLQNLDKETE